MPRRRRWLLLRQSTSRYLGAGRNLAARAATGAFLLPNPEPNANLDPSPNPNPNPNPSPSPSPSPSPDPNQATLATTQSSLDEMLGQAQQRNQQLELLQQRVEVRARRERASYAIA